MGLDVGFEFYIFRNGKLEEANIIDSWDNKKCNYLNICGRCNATYLFTNLIDQFRKKSAFSDDAKPEDKYTPHALLNHQEMDGYEDHTDEKNNEGWFRKYFFLSLNDFKTHFNFEEVQEKHDNLLKELNEELVELEKEVESLRVHQENAKTKVSFNCFEEKIKVLKEEITYKKAYVKDTEEDDYDYNHYVWIKEDIEKVEEIIKKDPETIVVAYASY